MYNSQINTRYAKSLFLLAEEKDQIEIIKKDVDLILQWLEDSKDLNELLEHPLHRASKKTEILSKLFEDHISEYTMLFLKLIVKNKRENHLKNICTDFIVLFKRSKGIKTAVLTTSFDLTRTHQENIKKAIEETFKSPVELNTKVDESILGGMIIQVDDDLLDVSVARQIQELRNQFLEIDFNKKKK
jgi:F-type H+-transporting ATPase subunit delta